MKILCVQEPWASAIVEGFTSGGHWIAKDVENRTWRPQELPGRIAIMATRPRSYRAWARDRCRAENPAAREFRRRTGQHWTEFALPEPLRNYEAAIASAGTIIGSVDVHGIIHCASSPWADNDCLNWLLRDRLRYETPVRAKGRLGLWEPKDPEIARQVEQAEAAARHNAERWPKLHGLAPANEAAEPTRTSALPGGA